MTPNGLVEMAEFDTRDGIYDCAWSEVCTSVLVPSVIFVGKGNKL